MAVLKIQNLVGFRGLKRAFFLGSFEKVPARPSGSRRRPTVKLKTTSAGVNLRWVS